MIVIFIFILGSLIYLVCNLMKKNNVSFVLKNKELVEFMENKDKSETVQMKLLINAARSNVIRKNSLNKLMTPLNRLYEDRLISEKYYNDYLEEINEIIAERYFIENEAADIKDRFETVIFNEVGDISIASSSPKSFFDEKMFLSRLKMMQNTK